MTQSSLPIEILYYIFQLIGCSTSDWKEARSALRESQLVCRKWSQPAKFELYKSVYLPHKDIAKFASVLQATSTTSKLGYHVKSIDFCPDVGKKNAFHFSYDLMKSLDIIIQHIPNIERFGSSKSVDFETRFIWSRLEAAKQELKHLKLFAFTDMWSMEDSYVYSFLALKHKQSLIKLRICPFDEDDIDFYTLKNHLKDFKSLKQLQICGALGESFITKLDKLINDCPQTTNLLQVQHCDLSYSHNYTGKVNPNESLQTLHLDIRNLPACSIRYFANKLKALRKLTLITRGPSNAQTQYTEWWQHTAALCQRLQHYSISINEFNPQNYQYQIKGCAEMLHTMAASPTLRDDSVAAISSETTAIEFIMDITKRIDSETHVIEIHQNGSRIGLFSTGSTELLTASADFDKIFRYARQFSPNVIRIFNSHCAPDPTNDKSWAFCKGILSLINKKTGSVIHLENINFPYSAFASQDNFDEIEQIAISEQTSVSELTLTCSWFYPTVFSRILSKIPNIGTLVLDRCNFMSDSRYKVEIDLTATKVDRIVLDRVQIIHSGASVFKPARCHTIILIGDSSRTVHYMYDKEKHCRTYAEIINTAGSASNFLISIKIKEVNVLDFVSEQSTEMKELVFSNSDQQIAGVVQ
ncbi:hypothetical protein BD408DRAFT_435871 [Parasitella parasitica]|nr:hypothetical protein BD408DRAFT_435871 [Parasitella parasitica]